jgi:hypothetical protein
VRALKILWLKGAMTDCEKVAAKFESFSCCKSCHDDMEQALGYSDVRITLDGEVLHVCCSAAMIADPLEEHRVR